MRKVQGIGGSAKSVASIVRRLHGSLELSSTAGGAPRGKGVPARRRRRDWIAFGLLCAVLAGPSCGCGKSAKKYSPEEIKAAEAAYQAAEQAELKAYNEAEKKREAKRKGKPAVQPRAN